MSNSVGRSPRHMPLTKEASAMIGCILVGSLLSVITVCIHAIGSAWWIRRLKQTRLSQHPLARKILPIRLLCSTALLLLLLHIAEVIPWSISYMLLPENDGLSRFEEACYFATVTFASLGYGDIVISGPWRLLSAIQAMTGLLVFGWSTALLFAVVERIWGDKVEQTTPEEPELRQNSRARQRPRLAMPAAASVMRAAAYEKVPELRHDKIS